MEENKIIKEEEQQAEVNRNDLPTDSEPTVVDSEPVTEFLNDGFYSIDKEKQERLRRKREIRRLSNATALPLIGFDRLGFVTIALFDVAPELIGKKIRDVEIYSLDELENFCNTHQVDIAALTMPKQSADNTAHRLVELGIHAIWNFAHVDLNVTDDSVVVENVHLSDSLMQLSYNIAKNKE